MKLSDFSGILPVDGAQLGGIAVSGISSDSRKTEAGALFFALPGSKIDGAVFAADAIRRGAAAIVASRGAVAGNLPVPLIEVEDARRALALAAARFFVSQPETMVAVTGTSGKTSVASFVRQIWEQAGFAAASIGTTGVIAPGRNEYGSLTTPDPLALHGLLAELAKSGVTHAAMEASSHGLDQRRLDGVGWQRAPLPISAATTWIIIRRSNTIITRSCACSTRFSKMRAGCCLRRRCMVGADRRGSQSRGIECADSRTARFVPAIEAGRA